MHILERTIIKNKKISGSRHNIIIRNKFIKKEGSVYSDSLGAILEYILSAERVIFLDSVTIYSNDDLTSLWNIVKDRFPFQTVWMKKNKRFAYMLSVKKQYMEEFCKSFSIWFHKKIWREELASILTESFVLTPEEEKNIHFLMPEYIKEYEGELSEIINQKAMIMLKDFYEFKINGFSNFCIQEYRKKLEEITNQCLEQYLSEQDYYEFLNLLQYFVEVEECQFGELIVVADENGNYNYFDKNFQNITLQCMEQFFYEFEEENPGADDCLITVLILLLPKRITICGIENITNIKFINTLKSIFGNRIEFRLGTDIIFNKKM